MIEVTVTIEMNGRRYRTNVIANKGISCEEIEHKAKEQVSKQWGK